MSVEEQVSKLVLRARDNAGDDLQRERLAASVDLLARLRRLDAATGVQFAGLPQGDVTVSPRLAIWRRWPINLSASQRDGFLTSWFEHNHEHQRIDGLALVTHPEPRWVSTVRDVDVVPTPGQPYPTVDPIIVVLKHLFTRLEAQHAAHPADE